MKEDRIGQILNKLRRTEPSLAPGGDSYAPFGIIMPRHALPERPRVGAVHANGAFPIERAYRAILLCGISANTTLAQYGLVFLSSPQMLQSVDKNIGTRYAFHRIHDRNLADPLPCGLPGGYRLLSLL
jgi:hypothetical protein